MAGGALAGVGVPVASGAGSGVDSIVAVGLDSGNVALTMGARVLEGDSVSLGEGFDVDRGVGVAFTCFEGVGSGSPAPPHAPKRPTPAASDTVRNKVFKNFIVCETVPSAKSLPG